MSTAGEPLVTVLMTVHNGEPFLAEAVKSILGQSFSNFEFVIVNDASTDNSADLIAGWGDPRIRLVRNLSNLGQVRSLNIGLRLARGRYVARLDQDDIARPRRLEHQADYLEAHPDAALVGTWCRFIDHAGHPVGYFRPPSEHDAILEAMARMNPFVHSAVMFRRNPVIAAGGYPENYPYSMDFALWLTLGETFRLANLREELLDYRVHPSSVSRRRSQYAAHRREELHLFRAALTRPGLPPRVRAKWRRQIAWTAAKLVAVRVMPGPLWVSFNRLWRRLRPGDGVVFRLRD